MNSRRKAYGVNYSVLWRAFEEEMQPCVLVAG